MFYQGIVEDRNDPLEIGRVRVRVIGLHTPDKVVLPTETLPWAVVMQPTSSPGASGVGTTPKLTIGTFVILYFLDGEDMQQPVVMGTIAGIQEDHNVNINGVAVNRSDYSKGFNTSPHKRYIGESDLPKLARSGSTDKPRARVTVENELFAFEEPEDTRPYRRYPYNQVRQSESGNYEEWDDTPGNERISTNHRTGTFTEFGPDGSKVQTIVKDNYKIVYDDDNVYIDGNVNLHVHSDVNTFVEGDYNLVVGGNMDVKVRGNCSYEVGDNTTIFSGKNTSISTGEDLVIDSGETEISNTSLVVNSESSMELNSTAITTNSTGTTINTSGNLKTNTSGINYLESGGISYVRGTKVHLNDTTPNIADMDGLEFQEIDVPEFEYVEPVIIAIEPDMSLRSSQTGLQTSLSGDDQYQQTSYSGLSDTTTYSNNDQFPDLKWEDTVDPNSASRSNGVRGLLEFISAGEGGYDSANNGTKGNRIVGSTKVKTINGRKLSELTVAEIMQLQKGKRETGRKLFAVGSYQIIPTTMKVVVRHARLDTSKTFDKDTQDLMGLTLLIGNGKGEAKRPRLASYLLGKSDDITGALMDMASEWASIPSPFTGKSLYGSGNKSSHSREEVKAALESARKELTRDSIDQDVIQDIDPVIV